MNPMRKFLMAAFVVLLLVTLGCDSQMGSGRFERFGKVYYIDGAGNLGFGQDTVPEGLRAAGFQGDVENFIWTTFTGPLGDQLIRINPRLRADGLKTEIMRYRRRYPDAPVNIIGLSAGTGVAAFAVESLPKAVMVDNIVMLGSSLASNYDMTACLEHVKGRVYFLYSSRDAVLTGFIPVTGTIDGQYLVEPAGSIGMRMPPGRLKQTAELYREKIVNVPWQPSFERYGYAGGHTDGTSLRFVKYYIAPKLLGIGRSGAPFRPPLATATATGDARAVLRGRNSPSPSPDGLPCGSVRALPADG